MIKSLEYDGMELVALGALAESTSPMGALRLAEVFRDAGLTVSEATAGRFLYQLDQRGMTKAVGTRGRILTDIGRKHLAMVQLRQQVDIHSAQLAEAVTATDIENLIDMLYVQRAIESEGAREAALHASDAEIEELAAAANTHVRYVGEGGDALQASMNFHLLVARSAHNRVLFAVVSLLLEPANEPLEELLEQIAEKAGVRLPVALEHREIVDAIRRRDPAGAELVMRDHFATLIQLATDFREKFDH